VGGALSALSTFDITVHRRDGAPSSQFSNINREDLKALEDFFKLKGLRVKNEIDEELSLIAEAMRDQDMDSSDDEAPVVKNPDRGSADEDEESVDEDFRAESDSDVAEEYDSNHESDGSGSDESDVDNRVDEDEMDVDDDDNAAEQPKKKKKKTG